MVPSTPVLVGLTLVFAVCVGEDIIRYSDLIVGGLIGVVPTALVIIFVLKLVTYALTLAVAVAVAAHREETLLSTIEEKILKKVIMIHGKPTMVLVHIAKEPQVLQDKHQKDNHLVGLEINLMK